MPEISEQLTQQIKYFSENILAKRLSNNLRNLLIEHLAIQKDGYSFDLEDLLTDILSLFELLDAMEREGQQ